MNLYLDIDGVFLTKEGNEANHLFEFLDYATKKFDCYWLTTHCKGDALTVLEYLVSRVDKESFELLKKIKPTYWETWKTEGIDFSKDFIWLDDYVFDGEKEVLRIKGALRKLVKINLKENPNHLLDLIEK